MPGSANPSVDRGTCKEFRDCLIEKIDGGIADLKEIQQEQRSEAREDFSSFATKTESAIGKIAVAHAELTGTVKANKEGVETLSKRGWGLLVLVLGAILAATLSAIVACLGGG